MEENSALDVNKLWNQEYGNLNLTYLSQLDQDKLVDGLQDIQQ